MPAKKTTGKAAHKKTENQFEIEQRRLKVTAGLLQGLTYREMAIQLNVAPQTIANDRKAIVTEWRKHYTEKADDWIEIQLRRLDVMINAIWQIAVGRKDADGKQHMPSLQHMDRLMRLIERQERLLGIGAGSPAQNPKTDVNVTIHLDDMTDAIEQAKAYEAEHYRNAGIPPEPSPN